MKLIIRKIAGCALLLGLSGVTPVLGQEKEVNFGREYIKANDQKTTIEINEAQELIYIILSVTEFGQKNPNMTRQNTPYFEAVKKRFSPYAGLPVVRQFDSLLNQNIINYFLLAGNAYGFRFKGDQLVPTEVYNFPAKGIGKFEVKTNPVITYLAGLNEFARKSGYRKFYKGHRGYYDSLKTEYKEFADIAAQKKWLESKFDTRINSYRVLSSPLIAGMNATHTFEDNDFKEMLLFLPTIKHNPDWNEAFNKAINTRVIFTEIDHNYVGPLSEQYKDRINTIFDNRDKWVDATNKSTEHYPNPVKVFDEYLTWGLFILYAYDHYKDEALLEQVVENVNGMMIKKGFPKGAAFNEELLRLYREHKPQKIAGLYAPLLDWSTNQ